MTVRVADELFPRACLHTRTSAIPPALNSHKSGDLHGSAFAADKYGRPWELNVRVSFWRPFLIALATCAGILSGPVGDLAYGQGRGRGQSTEGRGRGQALVSEGRGAARQSALNRQLPRGYQEPAFARGYGDGRERGLADGKARERYDPADSVDYRNGDQGYSNSYGSRDAYKSNYRAGFRQGYEEGYRQATR
jgi:hypothetical protein